MLKKLTPDLYVKSIYHIDLDDRQRRGIRAIITDLDNTLVAWDDPLPNQRLIAWLKGAQAKGFSVYIVSNNSRDRVQKFARAFGVPAISTAIKPRRGAIRTACEAMGVEPKEAAMVGDQVFTESWGNRLGLTPSGGARRDKEFWTRSCALERLVLRRRRPGASPPAPTRKTAPGHII